MTSVSMPNESVLAACLSSYANQYDVKLHACVGVFGSLTELYVLWQNESGVIPDKLRMMLTQSWSEPQLVAMAQRLEDGNIQTVVYGASNYPALLAEINDAPYVLYYHGQLSIADCPCVAMVGTRMMSAYGKRVISHLLNEIPFHGLCIVSGLALGVDAAVHTACVELGIPTLAVLGGGLDRYEPRTNETVGKRIIESGGCIVSEYPPGVRPEKHHFLARNRIIAGLSRMTVVIEGKAHSGSLVTARSALGYGREVGVVPGDLFAPNCAGTLLMLEEGAWPIISGQSILRALNIETAATTTADVATHPLVGLLIEPLSLDEIVVKSARPLREIQSELTELELLGHVVVNSAGHYHAASITHRS